MRFFRAAQKIYPFPCCSKRQQLLRAAHFLKFCAANSTFGRGPGGFQRGTASRAGARGSPLVGSDLSFLPKQERYPPEACNDFLPHPSRLTPCHLLLQEKALGPRINMKTYVILREAAAGYGSFDFVAFRHFAQDDMRFFRAAQKIYPFPCCSKRQQLLRAAHFLKFCAVNSTFGRGPGGFQRGTASRAGARGSPLVGSFVSFLPKQERYPPEACNDFLPHPSRLTPCHLLLEEKAFSGDF